MHVCNASVAATIFDSAAQARPQDAEEQPRSLARGRTSALRISAGANGFSDHRQTVSSPTVEAATWLAGMALQSPSKSPGKALTSPGRKHHSTCTSGNMLSNSTPHQCSGTQPAQQKTVTFKADFVEVADVVR